MKTKCKKSLERFYIKQLKDKKSSNIYTCIIDRKYKDTIIIFPEHPVSDMNDCVNNLNKRPSKKEDFMLSLRKDFENL